VPSLAGRRESRCLARAGILVVLCGLVTNARLLPVCWPPLLARELERFYFTSGTDRWGL
jgi:hypothetical protein